MFLKQLMVVLCLVCLVKSQKSLPSYFPKCYRDDPKLDSCLLKATEQVRPYLQKGVPEVEIPSISPLKVSLLSFGEDSDLANYSASLSNIVLKGLDNYRFKRLDFNPKDLVVAASLEFDLLDLTGNFSIAGKLLGVPVEGAGGFGLNLTDSNTTMKLDCALVSKKGVDYLQVKNMDSEFYYGNYTYFYNGLYEDLPRFLKIVDQAIHDYDPEILRRLRPALSRALGKVAQELLFKKLYKIPYDKLFPLH